MEIFTLSNVIDLALLVLLQAVLGFDNLLYISLESQRAPAHQQASVRRWGIGLAVFFRIILLFLILKMVAMFQSELFSIEWGDYISATFNFHSIIVLVGGVFILYTAMKEILHMMSLEDVHSQADRKPKSVAEVIFLIVSMNVVFSFDSILSAMAISKVFPIMAAAILIGGALMILLADTVSDFLQKNRMYEVVGLFILFLVGVMLLSEAGHLAHIKILGSEITQMSKATFYFILVIIIVIDVVQSRYQRKLLAMKEANQINSKVSG